VGAKFRVERRCEQLQDRLLDEAVQHRRDAQACGRRRAASIYPLLALPKAGSGPRAAWRRSAASVPGGAARVARRSCRRSPVPLRLLSRLICGRLPAILKLS
jgi:hypothetical protein